MTLKRFILIMVVVFVVFSCNAISASDLSLDDMGSQEGSDLIEVGSNDLLETFEDDSLENSPGIETTSSEDYVVWVGTNSTPEGQGTEDDPFPTLDSACAAVNNNGYKSKVTVNIDDGTYYIGSLLQFDTHNLCINGSGSVILKNSFSSNTKQQSFGFLSPESGNFTMNNIVFDASDYNIAKDYKKIDGWFSPFMNLIYDDEEEDYVPVNNNIIEFNNCQWVGYENKQYPIHMLSKNLYVGTDDITFNYCRFSSSNGPLIDCAPDVQPTIRFNYCVFSEFSTGIGLSKPKTTSIFDNCWLGHNNGYTSSFYAMKDYRPGTYGEIGFTTRCPGMTLYRHAVLDVSENYLGDNTYEITGKLMWNDGTDDNIDKLGSMTVYLSADNGGIPTTATLENGTFKVTYTADSDYHEIAVVLDSQKIKLNNKINFTLDSPTINYGDNQNITVTFPSNVNGTVYVTVNNKIYHKYVDDQNSVSVSIDDSLTKGNYPVDVSFAYDKNEFDVVDHRPNSDSYTVEEIDSFGFNTTKLTVNALNDYAFDSTITPSNVYIGEAATVTLSLPEGANGTVTVKVGDNEAKTFNVNETISIEGFVAGNNIVNITYNGNDIYDAKSIVKNISALTKPTIEIPEISAGKATTTTINLPQNATGNITVTVDGKEYSVVNLTNGSATVTIPELPAGKHNVTITYSGDGNYSGFTQTSTVEIKEPAKPTTNTDSKPATVKKTATKITAKKKTFKAKVKVKKYTITLKAGKKAVKKVQVTLKIGKKTYKAKTNAKGKATFKIKKLTKKGKYTAKITFRGNKLYKASSKKVKITVKK